MVRLRVRARRLGGRPGQCPYCGADGVRFALGWIPSLRPRGDCPACGLRPALEARAQTRYAFGVALLTALAALGMTLGIVVAGVVDNPAARLAVMLALGLWWWLAVRGLHRRWVARALLSEVEDPLVEALYQAVREQVTAQDGPGET